MILAHNLMAGAVLTHVDLEVADWPADLTPEGAVDDPATLVGKSLGAGMSRGEPVTSARLRGPGLLTGAQTGLVAAHVRLADPAMAAMATPGDHVDLISPAGKALATDVPVLAVDARPAGSSWVTHVGVRRAGRGDRGRLQGHGHTARVRRPVRAVRRHVHSRPESAGRLTRHRDRSPHPEPST